MKKLKVKTIFGYETDELYVVGFFKPEGRRAKAILVNARGEFEECDFKDLTIDISSLK